MERLNMLLKNYGIEIKCMNCSGMRGPVITLRRKNKKISKKSTKK